MINDTAQSLGIRAICGATLLAVDVLCGKSDYYHRSYFRKIGKLLVLRMVIWHLAKAAAHIHLHIIKISATVAWKSLFLGQGKLTPLNVCIDKLDISLCGSIFLFCRTAALFLSEIWKNTFKLGYSQVLKFRVPWHITTLIWKEYSLKFKSPLKIIFIIKFFRS